MWHDEIKILNILNNKDRKGSGPKRLVRRSSGRWVLVPSLKGYYIEAIFISLSMLGPISFISTREPLEFTSLLFLIPLFFIKHRRFMVDTDAKEIFLSHSLTLRFGDIAAVQVLTGTIGCEINLITKSGERYLLATGMSKKSARRLCSRLSEILGELPIIDPDLTPQPVTREDVTIDKLNWAPIARITRVGRYHKFVPSENGRIVTRIAFSAFDTIQLGMLTLSCMLCIALFIIYYWFTYVFLAEMGISVLMPLSPLPFFLLYLAAILAYFYFAITPMVLDTRLKAFWRRKAGSQVPEIDNAKDFTRFDDIAAIQLICDKQKSRFFKLCELNFVLTSGKRLNIAHHRSIKHIREDAAMIAEATGAPLFTHECFIIENNK